MSHIVISDFVVNDLNVLEKAAEKCGLELVRNQKHYKWFGKFMGDYPLPEGFNVDDLGKCDHVIRVKDNSHAYEIGVVKNKDGKGYSLIHDFWDGGKGLEKKAGQNLSKLKQEYTIENVLSKIKNKKEVKRVEEIREGNKLKMRVHLR